MYKVFENIGLRNSPDEGGGGGGGGGGVRPSAHGLLLHVYTLNIPSPLSIKAFLDSVMLPNQNFSMSSHVTAERELSEEERELQLEISGKSEWTRRVRF